MIDEIKVKTLCNKFNITPQIFHNTDTILFSTGIDNWKIVIDNINVKPIGVYHKNLFNNNNHYHFQRRVNKLEHAFEGCVTHKDCFTTVLNTYNKYNKRNIN